MSAVATDLPAETPEERDRDTVHALVLAENDQHVLSVLNPPKGGKPRGLGVPTGGLNPDEDPLAGAAREIQEEARVPADMAKDLLSYVSWDGSVVPNASDGTPIMVQGERKLHLTIGRMPHRLELLPVDDPEEWGVEASLWIPTAEILQPVEQFYWHCGGQLYRFYYRQRTFIRFAVSGEPLDKPFGPKGSSNREALLERLGLSESVEVVSGPWDGKIPRCPKMNRRFGDRRNGGGKENSRRH